MKDNKKVNAEEEQQTIFWTIKKPVSLQRLTGL